MSGDITRLIEESFPFAQLGAVVGAIGNSTGMRWGLTTDPALFWQRSPAFNVFEALVFWPLAFFLWRRYAQPYYRRNVTDAMPQSKASLIVDKFLGWTLAAAFALQVYIKGSRPNPIANLFWMTVPCHLITASWAFVLLQPPRKKNLPLCRFIGAMMTMSSWGAVAATVFPDLSDQRFFFEKVAFFVHHSIMLVVPHYWAAVHGLPQMSRELCLTYICATTFLNWCLYTPLSYVTGVNLNYNMHQHQGLAKSFPGVADSRYYRFGTFFAIYTWSFTYYALTHALNRAFFLVTTGISPPVMVSPEPIRGDCDAPAGRASSPLPSDPSASRSPSRYDSNKGVVAASPVGKAKRKK